MQQQDNPWPSGRQGNEPGALERIREGIIAFYSKLDTPYLPRMVILGAVIFHYLILGFKYIFWGATFGSAMAKYLKLTPEKLETLLGAGAAAGIAGTFPEEKE